MRTMDKVPSDWPGAALCFRWQGFRTPHSCSSSHFLPSRSTGEAPPTRCLILFHFPIPERNWWQNLNPVLLLCTLQTLGFMRISWSWGLVLLSLPCKSQKTTLIINRKGHRKPEPRSLSWGQALCHGLECLLSGALGTLWTHCVFPKCTCECPDPQHDCYMEIGSSGVSSAGMRSLEWNSDSALWPKKVISLPGGTTWDAAPPQRKESLTRRHSLLEPSPGLSASGTPRRQISVVWATQTMVFWYQPERTKTAFIGSLSNKKDKNVLWSKQPQEAGILLQSIPNLVSSILVIVYWVVEARHCALWTYSCTHCFNHLSPQSNLIRLIACPRSTNWYNWVSGIPESSLKYAHLENPRFKARSPKS